MSDPGRPSAEPSPIDIGAIDLTAEPPAPDPATKRSRIKTVVLYGFLAVAVAGVATIGYTGWQISTQKDATLTLPGTIGSLRVDTSTDGTDTADYLKTVLAAEISLDESTGAVYLDGTGKNVLFMGGTGLIWTPDGNLDSAFGLVDDEEGAVTDIHEVDAGPLSGTMKCGTTKSDDGAMAVCGWADHGSVALAMFPDRTPAEAAPLLREIRSATQKRS